MLMHITLSLVRNSIIIRLLQNFVLLVRILPTQILQKVFEEGRLRVAVLGRNGQLVIHCLHGGIHRIRHDVHRGGHGIGYNHGVHRCGHIQRLHHRSHSCRRRLHHICLIHSSVDITFCIVLREITHFHRILAHRNFEIHCLARRGIEILVCKLIELLHRNGLHRNGLKVRHLIWLDSKILVCELISLLCRNGLLHRDDSLKIHHLIRLSE